MNYSALLLDGAWQMEYSAERYTSRDLPEFEGVLVKNAVPAYWEDLTEAFRNAPFFDALVINPEYGNQRYPIAGSCPDMALPNVLGNFFYRRAFTCEKIGGRASLYFGGVMNAASVWLNGSFLGRHEGYSTPFEVEIPEGLLREGENTVVLSVSNCRLEGFDGQPVVGITSRAACECSGGITDRVELRTYYSPLRDLAVLISQDCKRAEVKIEATASVDLSWSVSDGDAILKQGSAAGDFSFETDGMELWSPEHPKLYTLTVRCGGAVLERRFGVRRLTVDGTQLRLNGTPYYWRGSCEHCYYPETVQPPHDVDFYRNAIRKLKELGFNAIRFHTHIPYEEYMTAADEQGILMHVESPNNTSLDEWRAIVDLCRKHTSTVIYCCGNELQLYDDFLDHLRLCAEWVHTRTDGLFSPMSALRGLEYAFQNEPELMNEVQKEPMSHNPRRFALASEFCDLYNSYTSGNHSYRSTDCDVEKVDSWSVVYNKPRLSHEICIDGTYTDLSLKERYRGTRIGQTEMFSSLESHLASKGLLARAPLYFKNSCEWQRRVRKYGMEAVRRCEHIAGYDFLGPIDTHWHTFGYDVGMMNEFYELKPTENVENVLRYNSPTVLLHDLGRRANFTAGEALACKIFASCYGAEALEDGWLAVRLTAGEDTIYENRVEIGTVKGGQISELYALSVTLPSVEKPLEMRLSVALDTAQLTAENQWELYLYPNAETAWEEHENLVVSDGMSEEELLRLLDEGRDVVLLDAAPFQSNNTSFKISLAGRTAGNLATVINPHPIVRDLPHGGFCGWQFEGMLEGGKAVILESDEVPFDPIIEVVSSHKNVIRQAALFEWNALNGRLLVSSFRFCEEDPAARWLKQQILRYARSKEFAPRHTVGREGLLSLLHRQVERSAENTNFAMNPNDKTATRTKKQTERI